MLAIIRLTAQRGGRRRPREGGTDLYAPELFASPRLSRTSAKHPPSTTKVRNAVCYQTSKLEHISDARKDFNTSFFLVTTFVSSNSCQPWTSTTSLNANLSMFGFELHSDTLCLHILILLLGLSGKCARPWEP
jgi:hypothetical protein